MDDCLSKPFERAQLAAVLECWLPPAPPVRPPAPDAAASNGMAAPPATPLPAPPAPAGSPLDQRALDQIRALRRPGAPGLLGKIIGLYLESSAGLLQQARDAVASADPEALRQAAHGLKSSSANPGATRVAASCRELEQRGREQRLEDAAELLRALETHYLRAREALTGQLEKGLPES